MFKPFAWLFPAAALRFVPLCGLAIGIGMGLAAAVHARQPPEPSLQQPQAQPREGVPQLDLPRLQLQAGLHLITVQVAVSYTHLTLPTKRIV